MKKKTKTIPKSEKELAEFAAKVANDINEGIDCGETRAELREVIKWHATNNCYTHANFESARTTATTMWAFLKLVYPHLKKDKVPESLRAIIKVMLDEFETSVEAYYENQKTKRQCYQGEGTACPAERGNHDAARKVAPKADEGGKRKR